LDLGRVSPPFQEQFQDIEGPDLHRLVEDGLTIGRLKIQPITVAGEQQREIPVFLADCCTEGGDDGESSWPLVGERLNGAAFLNPALDLIDTAGQAQSEELAQFLAVSSGFAGYPRRRFRTRPWIDELGHRCKGERTGLLARMGAQTFQGVA
jgi:hypothetical protein